MFVKITEQPSLYDNLEQKSISQIVTEINTEDQKSALAVSKVLPEVAAFIEQLVPRMQQGGRLFYIGAGTSGRLGIIDATEIPPTYGLPQGVVIGIIAGGYDAMHSAIESAEDNPFQGWEDLAAYNPTPLDTLIGVAASGTTPYVKGALERAAALGMLTAAITSNPGAPITQVAQFAFEPVVGPEYVTGSSRMKSASAQKMILNMISTTVMIKLGRVKGNRMVNMHINNAKLRERGTRMIVSELHISEAEALDLLLKYGSVQKALESYSSPSR